MNLRCLLSDSVLIIWSFQEPEVIGSEGLHHASSSNFYLNPHHLAKFIQIQNRNSGHSFSFFLQVFIFYNPFRLLFGKAYFWETSIGQ